MFITALFTVARKWKQSTCSPTEEAIMKMHFIHTMKNYSTSGGMKLMESAGKLNGTRRYKTL